MQRALVVANWKMHGDRQFISSFASQYGAPTGVDVVICPPLAYLALCATAFRERHIRLGAQNVAVAPNGAFTGEPRRRDGERSGCGIRDRWPFGTTQLVRRERCASGMRSSGRSNALACIRFSASARRNSSESRAKRWLPWRPNSALCWHMPERRLSKMQRWPTNRCGRSARARWPRQRWRRKRMQRFAHCCVALAWRREHGCSMEAA